MPAYGPDSSRDADLPSMAQGLIRSLQLAYRAEPRLLLVSSGLLIASWLPEALNALWLKYFAQGISEHRSGLVQAAAFGLAASATAAWFLRTLGSRIELAFRERATIFVESHVARLQAGTGGIEHHERPEHLDRLQMLREQAFLLNHLWGAFMSTAGSLGRLLITVLLLMSIHPALIALALFAIPTVLVSSRRAAVERRTQEAAGSHRRLTRHLFEIGTGAGPAKEVRVAHTAARLITQRRDAWARWWAEVGRARWASAAWNGGAWALFGVAYIGAVAFVAYGLQAGPGNVLLALAAGANLSRYLGVTVGQAEFLRWTIDATRRLVWLERYAKSHDDGAESAAPERLRQGIRLEHVSFRYPGTEALVLDDVNLNLPARSVVALVGENGAGKTTLVKLLCKFYPPSEGRICVDETDLARVPAATWRRRLAGAFQDFFRFEFLARTNIGLGDLPRLDDAPVIGTAVERAGAGDVVTRLPRGLDTQLGPTWHDGVELSFGQWQKLALARGFMRDSPLLVVLDEPTAALDAETEHALFERFAAASHAANDDGRITVLVSHRFSTVRMADLIVVLDGARVAELGSHSELMARNGLYAELYGI